MKAEEKAVLFTCEQQKLVGIVHVPQKSSSRGVLIIVGGPQYRVGSHRQFVLAGRRFAEAGFPTMRFDYRGMGDSDGQTIDFQQTRPDIKSAIDTFTNAIPQIKEVILWGLCDAASAILLYAYQDDRVSGTVLLNPWTRTEGSIARTYLKHYYFSRLLSGDFWEKIVSGRFNPIRAIRELLYLFVKTIGSLLKGYFILQKKFKINNKINHKNAKTFPENMFKGLQLFKGTVMFVLSGDDLTAQDFRDTVKSSRKWNRLMNMPNVKIKTLIEANHTFSSKIWRNQVEEWTLEFLRASLK